MVSLAVLAQSVVIALLVLSLPLFRRRTMGTHRRIAGRSILPLRRPGTRVPLHRDLPSSRRPPTS
jgi:hypothetical protein